MGAGGGGGGGGVTPCVQGQFGWAEAIMWVGNGREGGMEAYSLSGL